MADDEPAGSFAGDHVHLDAGRAAVFAFDSEFRPTQADSSADAGRDRVSVHLWAAITFAISPGSSVCPFGGRPSVDGQVRTGGIDHQTFRRELELARADLVSHRFHADHRATRL